MKNTEHFNIPYPEPTDLLLQFPDQLAKPTAELIDTLLYEQEQKQTALDAALDGKAPLSHTHSTSQVNGLDEALDGKAPLSHTHSTSQVTGLDAALAGKAPLNTLNTRVPETLALRMDTTVGTRVFAGNTMIYGDTGWRLLGQDDLINGWTFGTLKYILLRRIGDMVFLNIPSFSLTGTEATGSSFMETPPGFSTYTGGNYGSLGFIGSGGGPVDVSKDFTRLSTPGRTMLKGQLSWVTQSAWPTTLPGLPG